MSTNAKTSSVAGGLVQVIGEICSGVAVGSSHSLWFVKNWTATNLVKPLATALGLASDEEENAGTKDEKPMLKVIGVGYGRTGTYSLALALEELGYPTLHTQHMYESKAILDMWTNEVFAPSIEANKATMGTPDFDLIAQHGFQATMDLPTALYFEQLMEYNPDCKFILTTRDTSQVWFRSWNTLTKAITVPTHRFGWMRHAKQINMYYRWLFALVNKDNIYLSAPLPLPDQDEIKAVQSYEEHNRRVREIVPPERLLEYNVKEGWEPLCEFLEVDNCPDKPYPKTNSALSVQVQAVSAMVVPITVTLVALAFVASLVVHKRKNKGAAATHNHYVALEK